MLLLSHTRGKLSACVLTLTAIAAAPPLFAVDLANAPQKQWPPSPALVRTMAEVRRIVINHHTLITHRRLPVDMGRKFAADIKAWADRLTAASGHDGDAGAEVKAMMDQLRDGASAVAGPSAEKSSIDGLVQIDAVLTHYPQKFSDQTWKPLR